MSNGAMYSTNHLFVLQSNSSSPGIIPGQFHPSLLSEYPRPPELHRQSRDYPGMTTQPLGPLWQSIPEYQSYTGSPGIVRDDYPTLGTPLAEYFRTLELHQQFRDCPGMATQPLCQNARVTPAVLGLSRDRMTTQPLGHSCQSIPEHRSYTSSPGIVQG